jgi:hypothetical protein
MKNRVLILLLSFLLLTGCATVVQTLDGPIPNHVLRGYIPSLDLQIKAACIRYYYEKEGDELLETYEYLSLFQAKQKKHTIYLDNLFVLQISILNPSKNSYKFVVNFDDHNNQRLEYEGNLSRKNFRIKLPLENSRSYKIWYEIRDEEDIIVFVSPTINYKVLAQHWSRNIPPRYSK